jgi:hypothetical protein
VIARRPARCFAALALSLAALACATAAQAEPAAPEAVFKRGAEALRKGEYGAAIDDFESLADQGFAHPDASYDRGLAYVMRVHAGADRPGDLGRAAAAFEETLLLRPGDRDADLALDHVRAEVTRRRARKSKDEVAVRPSLDRLVVGLASEQVWGLSALAASLLFAAGLVLWRRTGRAHLVGAVLAPTAAVALLIFLPLTWGARHLRVATRPGVVVMTEVALTDDEGKPRPNETIPEAAAVETGERRGGSIHVRWGSSEGWVPATSVRLIGP